MEIIQTIGTILLAMTALGFIFLAVFDRPLSNWQRARMSPDVESDSGITATVRLLRASLALAGLKLPAAEKNHLGEAGDTRHSPRVSQDLEKVA
jgi:hypothetical protein